MVVVVDTATEHSVVVVVVDTATEHGLLQNTRIFLTCEKVHKVQNPARLLCKTTSERPKVLRTCVFLALLTWTCASRHKGMIFSTS